MSRPPDNHWGAVAAFPCLAFLTLEWRDAAVRKGNRLGAIVRREDDDGVVEFPHVLELLEDVADVVVHLLHAGFVDAQSLPPCSPTMAMYLSESTVVTCIRAGLYQTKNGLFVFLG